MTWAVRRGMDIVVSNVAGIAAGSLMGGLRGSCIGAVK
eukprot:CAMPEP_0174350660 /NCGR_PEP_ID=MMETSP0811_2-20130205/7787_1 /TAXON_ID=73025 ORGANISM="Eutreptiella gymnastica-like, Strain CCMP1594" /NCGR_SAMPLE_ID=MMETSP0811_2 /ASSEMBLY_ACC=CAM_ASM_000667 /LENGTH=37 /DNA_ID= /DNA_START= /DNA_END= /DNA_ORIENTATION=